MNGDATAAAGRVSRDTPVVSLAGDGDRAEWDAFVLRAQASGYHAWAWRDVFRRAFGHAPLYFIARAGGQTVGVLPTVFIRGLVFGRTLTSLPFVNYGGVVAESPDAACALLEAALTVARERRCRHLELRHTHRLFPQLHDRQHKVAMRLRLAPGLWERLDRKVRNQVRKAEKSGLSATSGGRELVDEFYTVFARNMRDLGTPVYARRFFEEILGTFSSRTRLHVVRLDRAPVAAALTYRTGGTIEVPWASSIRTYNSLCPNQLLYWTMIQYALDEGSDSFDFGRSTPGGGTYRFKAQWGAEPHQLHWEYWTAPGREVPDTSPANPRYRLAIALWKKLPLPISRAIGPLIVRLIP